MKGNEVNDKKGMGIKEKRKDGEEQARKVVVMEIKIKGGKSNGKKVKREMEEWREKKGKAVNE